MVINFDKVRVGIIDSFFFAHSPLNQYMIKRESANDPWWMFVDRKSNYKGYFLNLAGLLVKKSTFNYNHRIYLIKNPKSTSNKVDLGVILGKISVTHQLDKEYMQANTKKIIIDGNTPKIIDNRYFSDFYLTPQKKIIYLLNPLKIIAANLKRSTILK